MDEQESNCVSVLIYKVCNKIIPNNKMLNYKKYIYNIMKTII